MTTRTGPQARAILAAYFSGTSRPSLSTERLMTWNVTSISRTFVTSSIQRLDIQAHGQVGSNQKSAVPRCAMRLLQSSAGRRRLPCAGSNPLAACEDSLVRPQRRVPTVPGLNLTRDEATRAS